MSHDRTIIAARPAPGGTVLSVGFPRGRIGPGAVAGAIRPFRRAAFGGPVRVVSIPGPSLRRPAPFR